jgi:hypothetical protein
MQTATRCRRSLILVLHCCSDTLQKTGILAGTKDQGRSAVRGGVAEIDIDEGNAEAEQMVFDTESVVIKRGGHIDLRPEKVDLSIGATLRSCV